MQRTREAASRFRSTSEDPGQRPGAAQGQTGRVRSDRQFLARQGTEAPGRGSAMRRPSLFAATLSAKGGRREPYRVGDRSGEGRRGGHHDSRPRRWPARTRRLGADSAPAPRRGRGGATARRPRPSGHSMASDPRGAARVRVRRDVGELKRRRQEQGPSIHQGSAQSTR